MRQSRLLQEVWGEHYSRPSMVSPIHPKLQSHMQCSPIITLLERPLPQLKILQLSLKVRQHPTIIQVDSLIMWLSFNIKNCHDKFLWQFPDMGQMAKVPRHFFQNSWPGENFIFPWHVETLKRRGSEGGMLIWIQPVVQYLENNPTSGEAFHKAQNFELFWFFPIVWLLAEKIYSKDGQLIIYL